MLATWGLDPRGGILEQEPTGTRRERVEDVFVMVVGGEHEYFGELSLLVMAAVALIPSVPDFRMSIRTTSGEPGRSGGRGGTIDCFAGDLDVGLGAAGSDPG
jgi:hypothetical protein